MATAKQGTARAGRGTVDLGKLIAANIESLRQRHGLSKKEMARRMGLDPSNYQKLMRQRKPKLRFNHEQISRLAASFNISPAVLVEDAKAGGAKDFVTRMRSVLTDRQARELYELLVRAGRSGVIDTALGVLRGLVGPGAARRN